MSAQVHENGVNVVRTISVYAVKKKYLTRNNYRFAMCKRS